jgi:hypothetical protein
MSHQIDDSEFRGVPQEDIEWKPLPAFPPSTPSNVSSDRHRTKGHTGGMRGVRQDYRGRSNNKRS